MATEKCDAWLNVGAMGRTRAARCERDWGHWIDNEEPGQSAHFGDGVLWIDDAKHAGRGPLPPHPELVPLRKLLTDTADAIAARDDAVVVLDDVVAEEMAQAVIDRYGIGGAA